MSLSFILLGFSLFTWGIGEGMFFVFQPIYLAQLGADTMTIASVYSAFGAAMMVAHIPAGYLADKLGRKPLLIFAWMTGLISTWMMAAARTLPAFIVGMLLYGLTASVSSPLNSYATAERGKLSPARAMTFLSATFNLGAVIGPLLGGWFGDHYDLRSVYFIAAGLFVVSTGILFFIKSQPRDHHDPEIHNTQLLRNPRFVGFLAIIFLVMFISYLPQPLTSRFLASERHLSLGNIGILGSVNGMGNAIFNLLLGQFSSQIGLILVQVCVAIFSVVVWKGTGIGWYAVGFFILGGYRTARPFILSTVRSLIRPSQMGLAYGIAITFDSLAMVLAPLLAGILYSENPEWVYPASLVMLFFVLVILIFLFPRPIREEMVGDNLLRKDDPSDHI